MMPGMDGFEFIATLRQTEEWQKIPVVVLTAKEVTPEEQGRLRGRVQSILQKGSQSGADLARAVGDLVTARNGPGHCT
jgi:CheY-like chemotaxis protein